MSGTSRESDCVAVSSLSPSLVSVSVRYVNSLRGGREVHEGGDVCTHIADSLHYTAETNATLLSNYIPIKTHIYMYIYCCWVDKLCPTLCHIYVFREGNGTPLQYSCLENPMDRGAWKAAVHGVSEGRTPLHFHFSLSCIGEGDGNPL